MDQIEIAILSVFMGFILLFLFIAIYTKFEFFNVLQEEDRVDNNDDIKYLTIARNDIDKLLCDPEFDLEVILHEALLYYLVELSKTHHGRQIIENNKVLAAHFGNAKLKLQTPNWSVLLGPKCPLGNTGPTGPRGSQWPNVSQRNNLLQNHFAETRKTNHGHPRNPQ